MKTFLLFFLFFITLFTFGQGTMDTLSLPFEEDFQTGLFETNGWMVEGGNIQIAGQIGNEAPSLEFNSNPPVDNYYQTITSAAVDGTGFLGGNVYLDFNLRLSDAISQGLEKIEVKILNSTDTVTVYSDSSMGTFDWKNVHLQITSYAKYRIFKVQFRFWGVSSTNILRWNIDNISVYRYCERPRNTWAGVEYPNHWCWVEIQWESPFGTEGEAAWLNWDNGENMDVVGLDGGGTFLVGIRFTPAQLVEYSDTYLKKIRIFPYAPGGTIVLKVWTGSNANQLLASQEVESYIAGQWNEFTLNNSVEVTGTSELWIGYEITHPNGIYVAGVDAGPAVAGYGDMISLDGSVWESMAQAYQLDYNWNLQGFVEPLEGTQDTAYLMGYNIYREGEWIGTTTELSYIDKIRNHDFDIRCYNVTAIYEDCESDFSNTSCAYLDENCFVGVEDIDQSEINISPVPAKGEVSVILPKGICILRIFNLLGNIIGEYKINPDQSNLTVALDNYKAGVYFVKFETMDGRSFSKKFVVSH